MKIIRVSGTPKDDFPKLNTGEKHKCFIKWKSNTVWSKGYEFHYVHTCGNEVTLDIELNDGDRFDDIQCIEIFRGRTFMIESIRLVKKDDGAVAASNSKQNELSAYGLFNSFWNNASAVGEGALAVYLNLRHDRNSNHWYGVYCPRFNKFDLKCCRDRLPEGHPDCTALFNAIIKEKDATDEQLSLAMSQEFSEWMHEALKRTYPFAECFLISIRIRDVFPVCFLEGNKVELVSPIFNGLKFFETENLIVSQDEKTQLEKFLSFNGKVDQLKISGDDKEGVVEIIKNQFSEWYYSIFREYANPENYCFVETMRPDVRGDEVFRSFRLIVMPGNQTVLSFSAKEEIRIIDAKIKIGHVNLQWGKPAVERHPWLPSDNDEVLIRDENAFIDFKDYQSVLKQSRSEISTDKFFVEVSITDEKNRQYTYNNDDILAVEFGGVCRDDGDNRIALFVDMGSTFTKTLAVHVDEKGVIQPSGNIAKIHEETLAFLKNKKLDGICKVAYDLPLDYKLTKEDIVVFKKRMANDPRLYGRFLADAILGLACWYGEQEHCVIDSVCWSFPATMATPLEFRDSVQQTVRELTRGVTVQKGESAFHLYFEHDSLRLMFKSVIKSCAEQVTKAQKRYEDKLSEIESDKNYKLISRGFFASLFDLGRKKINSDADSSKNAAYAEELGTPWYRAAWLFYQIIEGHPGIEIDSNLACLDAGGYSLDSFVCSNAQRISDLSKSFEAGGEQLFKLIFEDRKKRNSDITKMAVRTGIATGVYEKDDSINNIFKMVYGDFANRFKERVFSKGTDSNACMDSAHIWCLVFSGGVSNNVALRRLFQPLITPNDCNPDASTWRGLSAWDLKSYPKDIMIKADAFSNNDPIEVPILSSPILYQMIGEILKRNNSSVLSLFKQIVEDPTDDNKPCCHYDIVGGMLQDMHDRARLLSRNEEHPVRRLPSSGILGIFRRAFASKGSGKYLSMILEKGKGFCLAL